MGAAVAIGLPPPPPPLLPPEPPRLDDLDVDLTLSSLASVFASTPPKEYPGGSFFAAAAIAIRDDPSRCLPPPMLLRVDVRGVALMRTTGVKAWEDIVLVSLSSSNETTDVRTTAPTAKGEEKDTVIVGAALA